MFLKPLTILSVESAIVSCILDRVQVVISAGESVVVVEVYVLTTL